MILPLRVLGRASVKRRSSGRARAPISLATHWRSSWRSSSLATWPCSKVTKQAMAWPFISSGGRRRQLRRPLSGRPAPTRSPSFRAVTADVDNVVDAAHQPEVAVGVAAGAVAGEVAAGDLGEVGLLVAGCIAIDGAGDRRPGLRMTRRPPWPAGTGSPSFVTTSAQFRRRGGLRSRVWSRRLRGWER